MDSGTRNWLSGVVVIVATIVAFIGFAHASFGWTVVVSSIVLVGLIAFLWKAGGGKERSGRGRR